MDFFRKHKKIVLVVLVVVLLLVFDAAIGFYGMRYLEKSAEQKEAVKVAVKADLDGFCDALESNDIATVKLFCTEDVVTQMGIDMMDADAFCALILDSLSLGEEDLSDEAKNSFDSMKKALKKAVLTGIYYDIEEMAIVKSDDAHDWEMTFVVGKDAEGNATSAMLVKAIEQKTDAADGSEE